MTNEKFMQDAFNEAFYGMRNNEGGPFGSIIVSNNIIIGRGHNLVTSTNDPTAHAEIVAIRNACKTMGNFHLPDAILFATCEPCPMCLAAIYWANIKTVYYCSDRNDAAHIGFSDKFIYDEFTKLPNEKSIKMEKINLENSPQLFTEWITKQNKISY